MTEEQDATILQAARMPLDIPEAKFGLWSFWRIPMQATSAQLLGGNTMAILGRRSWRTPDPNEYEVVMEDSAKELRCHLPIFRHGYGNVLVSGLGLGCVVRGLLTKSEVVHIDVVEIDRGIIDHFGPQFKDNPRVTLHHGNALTYAWPNNAVWDVAWHDIVCVRGDALTLCHARLVARFYHRCDRQGWWGHGVRIAHYFDPGHIIAA